MRSRPRSSATSWRCSAICSAGADGVGEADPLGARGTGELEDQAADRVRGEFAVGEEVFVGLVAPHLLVLAVGLDEPEKRLGSEHTAADRRLQSPQEGVAWRLVGARRKAGL